MPISWGLKASAHYVLWYLAGVVDGTCDQYISAMADGKYKYLKMSVLQYNIVTSQFIECFIDQFYYILKSIKRISLVKQIFSCMHWSIAFYNMIEI